MAEKDTIYTGKVQDKAIFDFSELYSFCYKWLVDENYDVTEGKYQEKVNPNGKEVEIEWEALKEITDYFRFKISVNWRIIGLKDVEVEKDNAKIKLNKGNLEIKVKAVLEKDYESRWEKNAFFNFLRGIYDKYIIKSRIEHYEEKLFSEADEFLAEIKSFLSLEGEH